jgi:hypothetical protein
MKKVITVTVLFFSVCIVGCSDGSQKPQIVSKETK